MKVSKAQLIEIVKSELNKITEEWILSEDGETITNPTTGRNIKVKTALSYPKDHPAYKAAIKMQTKSKSGTKSKASVASSDKSTKIINKLFDTGGDFDINTIKRMKPDNKKKLAKVLDTRIKEINKIHSKMNKAYWNDASDDVLQSYEDKLTSLSPHGKFTSVKSQINMLTKLKDVLLSK